jgi:hypothetical protein
MNIHPTIAEYIHRNEAGERDRRAEAQRHLLDVKSPRATLRAHTTGFVRASVRRGVSVATVTSVLVLTAMAFPKP